VASLEQEIKQTTFANELLKANINILFTANWLYNKISSNLKPYNVTHEQFNVLRILRGSLPKSMSQKDILSRMIAPNSNLTLITKKLVYKKLIQVIQSELDKREYKISITKAGISLLEDIDKMLNKKSSHRYNNLSISEAFHLNALLDKFREE
jgi:DNA-binding MarR family transcriptional regulator